MYFIQKHMSTTGANKPAPKVLAYLHLSKSSFLTYLPECQGSPKDKQTEGVGVQRYASPSVCAVSQNILQSKLFYSKKSRIIGVDYVKIKRIFSLVFSALF